MLGEECVPLRFCLDVFICLQIKSLTDAAMTSAAKLSSDKRAVRSRTGTDLFERRKDWIKMFVREKTGVTGDWNIQIGSMTRKLYKFLHSSKINARMPKRTAFLPWENRSSSNARMPARIHQNPRDVKGCENWPALFRLSSYFALRKNVVYPNSSTRLSSWRGNYKFHS